MSEQKRHKKRRAYLWGQGAEWLSALLLTGKGYRILARRFKCRGGEIDLIVRKGDMICFIEVKARKTIAQAVQSLSPHQQRRIIRAAEWYLAHNNRPENQTLSCRFDVVAVEPWRLPAHIKNAWQAEIRL